MASDQAWSEDKRSQEWRCVHSCRSHGAGIACLITGKGNEIKLSSRKSDICYDVGATFRDSDQYDQATG